MKNEWENNLYNSILYVIYSRNEIIKYVDVVYRVKSYVKN